MNIVFSASFGQKLLQVRRVFYGLIDNLSSLAFIPFACNLGWLFRWYFSELKQLTAFHRGNDVIRECLGLL